VEAVQCSCTSMAQCMRHAPLDIFTPSCLDMHGEYILTLLHSLLMSNCWRGRSVMPELLQQPGSMPSGIVWTLLHPSGWRSVSHCQALRQRRNGHSGPWWCVVINLCLRWRQFVETISMWLMSLQEPNETKPCAWPCSGFMIEEIDQKGKPGRHLVQGTRYSLQHTPYRKIRRQNNSFIWNGMQFLSTNGPFFSRGYFWNGNCDWNVTNIPTTWQIWQIDSA